MYFTVLPKQFQSSPALSSGRYGVLDDDDPMDRCFNPRPPFRAGATFRERRGPLPAHVSILARPFERALRSCCGRPSRARKFQSSPALSSGRYMEPCCVARLAEMFQSSPALSSGRYQSAVSHPRVRCVSILARPFERALPEVYSSSASTKWFQSSPALSSGRYNTTVTNVVGGGLFQSSPALSSGRYGPCRRLRQGTRSFNPRPPFRAGATGRRGAVGQAAAVSILARPFERALPCGRRPHAW